MFVDRQPRLRKCSGGLGGMGGGCVVEGEDFGEAGISSSSENKTRTGLLGMEVKFQQLRTSQNESCSDVTQPSLPPPDFLACKTWLVFYSLFIDAF